MIKILFICHGNICRSVACEYVMKDIVKENGKEKDYFIESAATSTEEIGNTVYPPMERTLRKHKVNIGSHRARQIRRSDYNEYDYLIGMDRENMWNMQRVWREDEAGKIHYLMDFTNTPGEVSDPWYTRDFERTYRDVKAGCEGLFSSIEKDRNL